MLTVTQIPPKARGIKTAFVEHLFGCKYASPFHRNALMKHKVARDIYLITRLIMYCQCAAYWGQPRKQ